MFFCFVFCHTHIIILVTATVWNATLSVSHEAVVSPVNVCILVFTKSFWVFVPNQLLLAQVKN